MKLEQRYQEIKRLKKEINQKMEAGMAFDQVKELMLALAHDQFYLRLKSGDNQLLMLDLFFNIWVKEKKKLPELGIGTDIFDRISGLDDVERKYRRIHYCGLRIENNVPEEYCQEALDWLSEGRVSGLAIGVITIYETDHKERNLLNIVQRLKQRGDILNALLLIQYANDFFPGQEELLNEETDIWLLGKQRERALEALEKIEKPSERSKERMKEIRRRIKNGG